MVPMMLRGIAVIIAVAAVIDPAVRSARRTRPLLSVVAVDSVRDRALLSQVTRALDARYTIVRAPLGVAAGTVLVGDRPPADVARSSAPYASPVVVVSHLASGPSVAMTRVSAPSRVMLDTRVTVAAHILTHEFSAARDAVTRDAVAPNAVSREVDVELVYAGTVVARTRVTSARDTTFPVALTFVPTVARPAVLQLRAFVAGSVDTVRHDVLVDVRAARWSVLFFDRRPSWISTFVRRALERDARFAVTSRIVTSTNVSRETGVPPMGLDAIAAAERFDAVVIGAPEALTARDVDGLTTLLRARGASVLLLPDHASAGPANSSFDAMMDFGGWRSSIGTPVRRTPADVIGPRGGARDSVHLRGMVVGVPTRLPARAEVLAVLADGAGGSAGRGAAQPVIWRQPVGPGWLYVSGAFDAWRYRDPAQSTFDATWRDLVDEAAGARQQALELEVAPTLLQPREAWTVLATARDGARAAGRELSLGVVAGAGEAADHDADKGADHDADKGADHDAGSGAGSGAGKGAGKGADRRTSVPVQVLGDRAPAVAGDYVIVATQGTDTVRQAVHVATTVARDAADDPALMAAWAAAHGGRQIPRNRVASLGAVLDDVLHPSPRMVTWHPMRSPWWIVPFALALAAEWWMRRRRGLA